MELAVHFRVLAAGDGGCDPHLSQSTLNVFRERIVETLLLLQSRIPWEDYEWAMRALRLVQLAHNYFRDDFGLACQLLVAGMEAAATKAVGREGFAVIHPDEAQWRAVAKSNPSIKRLLAAYRQYSANDRFLKKRFITFIQKYAPVETWEQLESPDSEWRKRDHERGDHRWDWVEAVRHRDEVHPNQLNKAAVRRILSDMYDFRSRFAHEGQSPPHRYADSRSRYFDVIFLYDKRTGAPGKRLLLPNFRLMAFITWQSINSYLHSLAAPI
jgi:hypothetical protein